jgi:hypothetical protein
LRNAVIHGYYSNNVFYSDALLSVPIIGMINKIYIDDHARKLYYFDGEEYVAV